MGDEASNFRRSSRTGLSSPKPRTGEDHGMKKRFLAKLN